MAAAAVAIFLMAALLLEPPDWEYSNTAVSTRISSF
jgi:hypothetical protein